MVCTYQRLYLMLPVLLFFSNVESFPFGLREAVVKSLDLVCEHGVLTPVESSKWVTPVVTPLNKDDKTC